jgi:hypothetical protein
MMLELQSVCERLAAGAVRHQARDATARAAVARATALTVAAEADPWVEAAVAIKAAAGNRAAVAEEIATGPIATLRLLLVTARRLGEIARTGLPRPARPPRILHPAAGATGPESFVGIDLLPEPGLLDGVVFRNHRATVRCGNPGGVEAFLRSWREEARERPRQGGVAAVFGAGNVTGLAAADAIAQIFEHGRAVLLKLHPQHAPLEPVLATALGPLVAADLLAIVSGGAEVARAAVAIPQVAHVHLTGGQGAFDALVWGGSGPRVADARPVLDKPITCELGNVTPWIIVPGRYTPAQLGFQADAVAASIANNTSFNCIATKCLVTCRAGIRARPRPGRRSPAPRRLRTAVCRGRFAAASIRPASRGGWSGNGSGPSRSRCRSAPIRSTPSVVGPRPSPARCRGAWPRASPPPPACRRTTSAA